MSQPPCPQEEIILKAARARIWEESLTTHLEACPECRELALASRWMQSLAQDSDRARPLPDPARVWWRAQLSSKQARAERAHEYVEWTELISASALCAALAAWIAWNWPAVQLFFARTLATALPHSWFIASPLLAVASAIFPLAAFLASLAAAVLAYPILARD
ncbi:MAG: hypothetical protein LAO19_04730 [Acidobacteriia bacterium]|nr:hypothetical protein [Terriglobia bacterium]